MGKHDEARLARAYLKGLMNNWPSAGPPARPSRDWRSAAIMYAALGTLGATACAGGAIEDAADAVVDDAGAEAAATDALEPVIADVHGDEEPSAIAMYAAPGCSCAASKGGVNGTQLWFGAAVLSWVLVRRRRFR